MAPLPAPDPTKVGSAAVRITSVTHELTPNDENLPPDQVTISFSDGLCLTVYVHAGSHVVVEADTPREDYPPLALRPEAPGSPGTQN